MALFNNLQNLHRNAHHKFWMRNQVCYPHSAQGINTPHGPVQPPVSLKWFQTDNEPQYRAMGNKSYGPDDISYDFNRLGYRSIELDPSSPNRKILFLGCSFTQGIGLPHHEMWSTLVTQTMEQTYGVPFEQHNYGLGGQGNEAIAMLAHQIIPILKPDLVVVLFTQNIRRSVFQDFDDRVLWLPENVNCPPHIAKALVSLQSDAGDFFEWVRNFSLIDATARANNVPWVWSTLLNVHVPPPEFIDVYARSDNLAEPFPLWPKEESARDGAHPGAAPCRKFAQTMSDLIIKNKYFEDKK